MSSKRYLALGALLVLLAGAGFLREAAQPTAEAMTSAAQGFLNTLAADSRAQATLKFDDPARTHWHFIPKDQRKGLQIKLMNDQQRERALALVKAGLSQIGYTKATTIMSMELVLHKLQMTRGGGPLRDPLRYYVSVFGQPGPTGRWGWSVEGHHLSLNFTVADGRVLSVTPAFYGANPVLVSDEVPGGPKKGTRVLEKEESLGFELLHSLSAEQRKLAVVAAKAPKELEGAEEAKPKLSAPAGLAGEKMTPEQRKTLTTLIETYIGNMPDDVAQPRLADMQKAGLGQVHFSWQGAEKPGVGHFYRVQGPTFVIELINVQPDSAGNPASHIHSVWRSVQGDFGL